MDDDEDEQLAMAVDADRDLLADTYRTRLRRPALIFSEADG